MARGSGGSAIDRRHFSLDAPAAPSDGIVMITGAYPPDVCGVGDYTDRLILAAPPSWRLFVERDWSLRAGPGLLRRLLALRPARIIIQYPTQGYGWSLVPHLLIIVGWLTRRYRSILALHEFSSLSLKARLALAMASHFAAHIVFTTETERAAASAFALFSSRVSTSVIGILSNIPCTDSPPLFAARTIDIAYFGHIRPNKGLEDCLDVLTGIRRANPWLRLAVIGEVPDGYADFGDAISRRCREIDCEMILDLDDQAVGRLLCDTRLLYLPFPDGVSARRGSVLAGLGNGALIATRIGYATPPALLPAIIPCTGTQEDVALLTEALHLSAASALTKQRAGIDYIDTMLPRDWSHVAKLYERAVAATLSRSPVSA